MVIQGFYPLQKAVISVDGEKAKMLRLCLKAFRAFKASIGALVAILGLVYVYPDLVGLPEAYGFEGWTMPEASTTLFILLVLSLSYIVWMDAKPFVRSWRKSRKTPALEIIFFNEINEASKYGPNKRASLLTRQGEGQSALLLKTEYLIGVKNTFRDKTIRNVSLVVHSVGRVTAFIESSLPVDGTTDEIKANIAPGQIVYFLLGERHQLEISGSDKLIQVPASEFDGLRKLAEYEGFIITGVNNSDRTALLRNDSQPMEIGIYGDDVPSRLAQFRIDARGPLSIIYLGTEDA